MPTVSWYYHGLLVLLHQAVKLSGTLWYCAHFIIDRISACIVCGFQPSMSAICVLFLLLHQGVVKSFVVGTLFFNNTRKFVCFLSDIYFVHCTMSYLAFDGASARILSSPSPSSPLFTSLFSPQSYEDAVRSANGAAN